MKGFGHPPAMHLLCMCSMLVPSEFSHLRKRSAKKVHFCLFPGICRISESAKKLQKLFGSALSHLIICCFFLILVRVIAQEAPKTLKWPSGCAHLLVHIRRPPGLELRLQPPCTGVPRPSEPYPGSKLITDRHFSGGN